MGIGLSSEKAAGILTILKPKRSLKNFLLNIKAREKDEEDEKKIREENIMNAADLKKAEDKLKKAKKLEQKSLQLQERVKALESQEQEIKNQNQDLLRKMKKMEETYGNIGAL